MSDRVLMHDMSEAKRNCWPWSHRWTVWNYVERKGTRKDPLTGEWRECMLSCQYRKCLNCGLVQEKGEVMPAARHPSGYYAKL